MRVFIFLLLLCITRVTAQSVNPCESGAGCCFNIDFESTPGTGNSSVPLQQGFEVLQDSDDSPWAASQGLQFTLDSSNVRPGTLWKYPIALLNASAVSNSSLWKDLFSSTDGLVLTAVDSLSPTLVPLRGAWILHIYSLNNRPICMEYIRLLRSHAWATKMTTVTVTLYDSAGTILDNQVFNWGLSVQKNNIDIYYSASNVVHIRISFSSIQGYGAVAIVNGCFGGAIVDSCGVCGGNNLCLPIAEAGDMCTVANTTDPTCALGHYTMNNDTGLLVCTPDLSVTGVELCNGVDDNCNGLIDENQPNVECGVGACLRIISSCANGKPQACVPGTPIPEVCNGVDDNCNGLIDEGGVCENNGSQPEIAELRVTPQLSCVSALTVSTCLAKFGYVNQDSAKNYTFLLDGLHNALYYPLGDGSESPTNVPVTWGSVPTFFAPGSSATIAFEAAYPCNGSVTWRLGDGSGRFIAASAQGTAALCQSDVPPWTVTRQITPTVDSACVSAGQDGNCTSMFGYYNPNTLPVRILYSSVDNSFYLTSTNTTWSVPAQPQTFLAGRNPRMMTATWPCSKGSLEWRVQGRVARANIENMC